MRIRRLSTVFWATSGLVLLFILFVITDQSFKLPSIKPAQQEPDDSKWQSFQSQIRDIETKLNEHRVVVGDLKSAVNHIVDFSKEYHPEKSAEYAQDNNIESDKKQKQMREYKAVGVAPPHMHVKFNMSTCAIQMNSAPQVDIQMLSMYNDMSFVDVDGGVWKQGWDVQYDAKQWSSTNKLKVFIVPHSHNDPGWLHTFETYYQSQTKAIFNNMVEKLAEGNNGRKFIWAETSYLSLWWTSDATEKAKRDFRKLLESGQIEIVTGGWVMNDEANSHWLSVIQQLTTGHQWLLDNLGYVPKNSWAIDPFGHSSTQPYLLKLAGFENSIIQRVHYRVKKELAMNRQLEFKWRQLWDGTGKTDMFTHMMPFYSYDIPHSCGPDPKICCQFDFKRLPGNGVTCPWGVAPRKIITKNVHERSSVILDQWRKKAQLYRSNVVFVPLGDDFRYDRSVEWDNQYQNYEMIVDYINNEPSWNAEVQFGTLKDYFRALHQEVKKADFPVLSGDFFTYADRNDHYWSGYYTSRPFYKNMDRVLLAYVRAAEIITGQAATAKAISNIMSIQLRDRVELARRALSLFQHHDGITGTAKDHVREDYAIKMQTAIQYSQSAIQQAAFYLLKKPAIQDQKQDDIYFEVDDIWRKHDEAPSRILILLSVLFPSKRIVLYNPLLMKRTEIITVLVSTPHVEVFNPEGDPIMAQITPVVQGHQRLGFAAEKYQLSFPVSVQPLSLVVYTVSLRDNMSINKYTSFSKISVYNAHYLNTDLPKMFAITQPSEHLTTDLTVRLTNGTRIEVDPMGLVTGVYTAAGTKVPLKVDFKQYTSSHGADHNSGAYLFIPAKSDNLSPEKYPEIIITEGPFKSTVYTSLSMYNTAKILIATTLNDNPTLPQTEIEVASSILIEPAVDDSEIALRFTTSIQNGDTFYTDLNGMQMIRRRTFSKLPTQANFYPLPAAAYIQDDNMRMTILTSTPLGMAALTPGEIQIIQDRRLSRDDNRGLNQGVMDNVLTKHIFKIILDNVDTKCESRVPSSHPSGALSLGAQVSSQLLLQPLVVMQYTAAEAERPAYSRAKISAADVVLASLHASVTTRTKQGKILQGIGATFQRVTLDKCYGNYKDIVQYYPLNDGQIPLTEILDVKSDSVYESLLTFVELKQPIAEGVVTLCPMEVRSVFINQTLRQG